MPVLVGHLAPRAAWVYGRGPWGWAGADPKGGTLMVRKALFMLLLAAVIVPAAQAGNGQGKPLDRSQAQILVSNGGASLGTSAAAISKDDALAASRQVGAQTELAPGFATPQQAIAAS